MNKVLMAGIALLGAVATLEPVLADEPPARRERQARPERQRPPPQRQEQRQTSNWDGGQLGGSNGASGVNNNFVEPGAYVCPAGFEFGHDCFETPFAFGSTKWVYTIGAFAGYRMQFGMFVAGVEADAAWKNGEHDAHQKTFTCFEFFSESDSCAIGRHDLKQGSIKQTWDASLRVRGGVLVTPWTLVYLTGGVAFGEIKGRFQYRGEIFFADECCEPPTAVASGSFKETRAGGTVGIGVESELFPRVKARAEYRYTDFGSFSVNLPVTTNCFEFGCDTPSRNVRIDLESSFHTIRFGVGIDLY